MTRCFRILQKQRLAPAPVALETGDREKYRKYRRSTWCTCTQVYNLFMLSWICAEPGSSRAQSHVQEVGQVDEPLVALPCSLLPQPKVSQTEYVQSAFNTAKLGTQQTSFILQSEALLG